MRYLRDRKGQVLETARFEAIDASKRKRWHEKRADGLGASGVQGAWWKSTPMEREGCTGIEPGGFGVSEEGEAGKKFTQGKLVS